MSLRLNQKINPKARGFLRIIENQSILLNEVDLAGNKKLIPKIYHIQTLSMNQNSKASCHKEIKCI